jgi:hypothetical protein
MHMVGLNFEELFNHDPPSAAREIWSILAETSIG